MQGAAHSVGLLRGARARDDRRIHARHDGECLFCAGFAKRLRIESALGSLRLVNARQGGSPVDDPPRGFDLDQGMKRSWRRVLPPATGTHRLALMSTMAGSSSERLVTSESHAVALCIPGAAGRLQRCAAAAGTRRISSPHEH
jgi:hypothetical protein